VVAAKAIKRGQVHLVDLNPTRRREIKKVRPCVVLSPDELNRHMQTHIVAPLTTSSHEYPLCVPCRFKGKAGHVVLDQLRTVDRDRLVRGLGRISPGTLKRVLTVLQEKFAP